MLDVEIHPLEIHGYAGKPVDNLFFRQKTSSDHTLLGVIFPGLRYSSDMPLLYYAKQILLARGGDVLQVDYNYTTQAFQSTSRTEQSGWMGADAQAGLQAGLAQSRYQQIVLVGKSIGTLALAYLVHTYPKPTLSIWLTPLLHQPALVEAASQAHGAALFIASRADPTFDENALDTILKSPQAQALVIENADHSLEIPYNPFQSLNIMQQVARRMDSFLSQHLPAPD